jgi:hypothetical protein
MVFLRYDTASQIAWLQVSPEPLFDTAVLWTVPTDIPFNSPAVGFTTETGPITLGLLSGIIYYQTATELVAVSSHNGDPVWNIPLPGTSIPGAAPIIGTVNSTTHLNISFML